MPPVTSGVTEGAMKATEVGLFSFVCTKHGNNFIFMFTVPYRGTRVGQNIIAGSSVLAEKSELAVINNTMLLKTYTDEPE